MSRGGAFSTFTGGVSSEPTVSRTRSAPEKTNPWLNAWSDPLAGIQVQAPCFITCDLHGDGDQRLVIANRTRPPKIREYRGTKLISEVVLPDAPVALAAFYPERPSTSGSKTGSSAAPSLAVAIGEHLFVYKELQPELKFRVPPGSLPRNERPLWMMLKQDLAGISREFPGVDVYEAVVHAAYTANLASGHHSPMSSVRRISGKDGSGASTDTATLDAAAARATLLIRTFILKLKHMRDNLAAPTPLSSLAKDLLALSSPSSPTSSATSSLARSDGPASPLSASSATTSTALPAPVVTSASPLHLDAGDRIASDGLPVVTGSQIMYAYRTSEAPLEVPACATCLSTVPRSPATTGPSISHVIIGAENNKVHVLNAQATEVMFSIDVPSPPVSIHVVGYIDVDYQLYFCCRDNNVYCAKKDRPLTLVISADGSLVEVALGDRMLYAATADNCIRAYTTHGKLDYKIPMMEPIVGLSVMRLPRQPGVEALLVALRSGRVMLMNGRECLAEVRTPQEEQEAQQRLLLGADHEVHSKTTQEDPVTAMRFAPYGREEGALLLAYRSGALAIKLLQRKFMIPASMSLNTLPPPEQDVPLDIPALTSLFLQQTERLREQSVDIHQRFEKDLCKLRLITAKTYLNMLTGAEGPVASSLAASLRVSAEVQGLGPAFRLQIEVSNLSSKPLHGLGLSIVHDPALTRVVPPSLKLPALFPSVEYTFTFALTTLASTNAVVGSTTTAYPEESSNDAAEVAVQKSLAGLMAVGMATNVTVQITSVASAVPLISSTVPIPAPQAALPLNE